MNTRVFGKTTLSPTRLKKALPLSLRALWRSRQALKELDAAALKDVGISAEDAMNEAARPVWDVPATWRR